MKWKLHNDPLQYWERSNRKTRNFASRNFCEFKNIVLGHAALLMNFVAEKLANLGHVRNLRKLLVS